MNNNLYISSLSSLIYNNNNNVMNYETINNNSANLLNNEINSISSIIYFNYVSNNSLTNTLLNYPTNNYLQSNYVNNTTRNNDISAINWIDIFQQNQINNIDSRITSTYNLLYSDFTPTEILAYIATGLTFANTIANKLEAYLIIQLRSRVLTIENSYLKTSNIVSTHQTGVINGTDDLETINNLQSKIIASNRNGVLIGNDYLITQ